MDYLRIDPRLDEHPDCEEAGFAGVAVFQAVLRAVARNDGHGRLRGKFAAPWWLVRRMGLRREDIGDREPEAWVARALERLVAVGLLERDGEDLLVPGWEKFYSRAQTPAERQATLRSRRGTGETVTVIPEPVTPSHASHETPLRVTEPVTSNATPLHSTQQKLDQVAAEPDRAAATPEELAPDLIELETLRAKRFRTLPIPIPIPDFGALWKAVLAGHEGDRAYAFQTFSHWLEDPWAQTRRPKGAINAFLAREQWPKHVLPRAQAPPRADGWRAVEGTVCGHCDEPAYAEWWEVPMCIQHYQEAQDGPQRTEAREGA